MIKLTEETIIDFIKEGKVIIKGWSDGCGWCDKLSPVLESLEAKLLDYKFGSFKLDPKVPSAFKRNHMKSRLGEPNKSVPCTFVFEDGVIKYKHHGFLEEADMEQFINTGIAPKPKPKTAKELQTIEIAARITFMNRAYY
jgi:thiol-disulfide isomerase/thioredoxin